MSSASDAIERVRKRAYEQGYEQGKADALRWIPVSERLPERYGRFIVTIVPDAGELWKTIEFVMYSDLMGLVKTPVFWQGNVGKSDFEDVTSKVAAWMPLPEPYEGGGE